nr:MAG TPA: hypothetical protein [Caudoviricetes sp.]
MSKICFAFIFVSPKIKGRINSFVPTILPIVIYYLIRVFILFNNFCIV